MKITEATWELENLGLQTMEFSLEAGDDSRTCIEDTLANITQNEREYNVVKLDSSLAGLIAALTQAGYNFIENQFIFLAQYSDLKLNSIQQRLVNSVDVCQLDANNKPATARLFNEIRRGMFDSDRIALDPVFTAEQAAQRYVNWIQSAMNTDSRVYEYIYRGQAIGFSVIRDLGNKTMNPFLGGMYPEFKKSGLGTSAFVKHLEIIAAAGAKATPVAVSSNNPAVWKLYLQLGYKLQQTIYVLVKHADKTC